MRIGRAQNRTTKSSSSNPGISPSGTPIPIRNSRANPAPDAVVKMTIEKVGCMAGQLIEITVGHAPASSWPGLDPAIHETLGWRFRKDVDGWVKPGDDGLWRAF